MASNGFYDVLTAAVNDLAENGYDSAERVAHWMRLIREAAEQTMRAPHVMEQMLREALAKVYQKLVDKGQILALHPGVQRFTLERVKPQLRAELDRRILASASLISQNRTQAVEKTLQRFSGWSTSIPAGGAAPGQKTEAKANIRKALVQLPFEERRVLIDQGHKLRASLSEILAKDSNAIAMIWHSHWRQANYNYREDHKERDQHVYLMRDNWASEKGFVKPGPDGYYDKITSVGEEPFCRCYAQWVYSLRDLPADMLTVKGKTVLEAARSQIAKMRAA